jgi:DNA-binding CsgD family transcriptional regulator
VIKTKPRVHQRDRVLALFAEHPLATSFWIAKKLDVRPEYVRATLKRNNRRLARSRGHWYLPHQVEPHI